MNFNKGIDGIYKISRFSVLEHSHVIEGATTQHSNEVQNEIREMKKIGISNFHIIRFIENKFKIAITQKDITNSCIQTKKEKNFETNMIFDYMLGKGECFIFEDLNSAVAGILTITEEEQINLQKYGDFFVIDGTSIPNYLGWTVIPISLQGSKQELLSGGVALTPSENYEFYHWLISTLLKFSPKLRCILTVKILEYAQQWRIFLIFIIFFVSNTKLPQ